MRIFIFFFLLVNAASTFSQKPSAVKPLVSNENYVISYQVTPTHVVFTMDDLRAREAGKAASEKMPYSFFSIAVDIDRNGKVRPPRMLSIT